MASDKKVAIITGAGSGIGRHTAAALVQEGYQVALAGRRAEQLEETAVTAGGVTLQLPTDVSDRKSVRNLFERVQQEFGRLDLLFNNAGTGAPAAPIEEIPFEEWERVLSVNLTGTFLCTQEAVRMMKSQDPMGGRIINNGSVSAHSPRPHTIPYTASKHGITGITKATSLEGRKYDIACGQIDIGNADTVRAAGFKQGTLQANFERAVEPTMDPKEVARAVVYMASLPLSANVQFMTVMATKMPLIGRG